MQNLRSAVGGSGHRHVDNAGFHVRIIAALFQQIADAVGAEHIATADGNAVVNAISIVVHHRGSDGTGDTQIGGHVVALIQQSLDGTVTGQVDNPTLVNSKHLTDGWHLYIRRAGVVDDQWPGVGSPGLHKSKYQMAQAVAVSGQDQLRPTGGQK